MKGLWRTWRAATAAMLLIALSTVPAIAGKAAYDVGPPLFAPYPFDAGRGEAPARSAQASPADPAAPRPARPYLWGGPDANGQTAAADETAGKPAEGLSKETKALLLNAGAVTAIAAYGLAKWDYFQTSAKFTPEGWFGRTTKSGGADKLGHFWSTYAASHLLAHVYREWGFEDSKANGFGALSALGVQVMMELGDAYSGDYGFSYEDLVMNMAGAGAAYVLGRYPELKNKIDLRVEYRPDSLGDLTGDVFSDYENQRYLIALKLAGFETFRDTPLGWLELHMGYFTRGYEAFARGEGDARRRSLYFGVGLNVSRLVQRLTESDFALFDYLQLPYTSVRTSTTLD